MNFVEYNDIFAAGAKEKLRIAEPFLHGRQIAVQVHDLVRVETPRERGLAAAAHAGKPDDRRFMPGGLKTAQPEGAGKPASLVCK
jgi:hypothetical protein